MALIDNSETQSSESIITIKLIYLFICFLLGVVGNLFVIISIRKYKKLQTITNFFVLNLAISDLLYSLCGVPVIFITTVAKKWLLGNFLCDAIGFLNTLLLTTSIWTLVMISINRYINVAKPNEVKNLYTNKRTTLIIIGVWIFSALISIPPLFGWSEFKSGSNFCTINGKKSKSYSLFLVLLVYLVPLGFLCGLYLQIFFLLNKHKKIQTRSNLDPICNSEHLEKQLTFGNVVFSSIPNPVHTVHCSNNNKSAKIYLLPEASPPIKSKKTLNRKNCLILQSRNAKENLQKLAIKKHFKQVRITKMLMVLVLSFFLCWTPLILGSLLYSFTINLKGFQMMTFGIMCCTLNCILNPFIYSAMNSSFRKCFFQMWTTIFKYIKCK
ncbi:mu-type opioid receptor [Hydra vulgaris]|uniref:mu-type opioid receptor n=1 Tax=Hydra vulgaris TaxID=6087 RepID=UPI001F5E7514|nr:mu-type opioid receptor-like [Hydra vulgaris]XP_047145728.1 mu-type opioid receptor-like [Hydra vulgaris]XP_047145729.1 mu-type opioid receptor-like [Hydra vulgaris]